jgi:diguanylate cyclase (GGDEF)-like protein
MSLKHRVVAAICLLLLFVSLATSFVNYYRSIKSSDTHLKQNALPLSIDNIYTEVQKRFIEPTLISSMMAHDTFVKSWLVGGEKTPEAITNYLSMVKEKYGMFTTFLVSEFTKNYYHPNGIIDIVSPEKPENRWYFEAKELVAESEINLDFNSRIGDGLIMFINYKILDEKQDLLGVTGIGIDVSYIHQLLEQFRKKYKFNVFFTDTNGKILLIENGIKQHDSAFDIKGLSANLHDVYASDTTQFEYDSAKEHFIVNTKFIPELNLFLFVEAKTSDFTTELKRTFVGNLIVSLFVTLIILSIIIFVINIYQRQLEDQASKDALTGLLNRRTFDEHFRTLSSYHWRHKKPMCGVIFDIDNFKEVNDQYGHMIGDAVLERLAECIKSQVRASDIVARWGGEEFALLLPNTSQEEAVNVCEKLRLGITQSQSIQSLIKHELTISLGLSALQEKDTITTLFHRADKALYKAKANGKNQTVQYGL